MFYNKAENLKNLSLLKIKNIKIPKFIVFKVKDWNINKVYFLKLIKKRLGKKICVRSSFFKEDSSNLSLAGQFNSFINLKNEKKNIIKSISNIKKQYKDFTKNKKFYDESYLILQNYLQNSICSGVITNFTLEGSPYYTINYNDISNSTSSVTSGDKDSFRVLYAARDSEKRIRSLKFRNLVKAIKNIEKRYNNHPLDIEFAIDKNLKVNILQIRPITTQAKWKKILKKSFFSKLKESENKYLKIKKNNINYGNKPLFGLMPDWNPAEIIGFQPHLFSYSMYKNLVTKKVWADARDQMGYKKLLKTDLMYSFAGKPYIDLRLSFHSFLPKGIKINTEKKIVNFWLEELKKKPYFHDKVEFEISDNCYYFNLKNKIQSKYKFLNSKEKKIFSKNLKDLTEKLINNYKKDYLDMNLDLVNLEKYRTNILKNYLKKKKDELNFANLLVKECKIKGILPFAKLARSAFIAKKILNSLVDLKVLSKKSYFKILSNLSTVSNDYIYDHSSKKRRDKDYLTKKYYHLRPNSYDILNKRYNGKINVYQLDKRVLDELIEIKNKNIDLLITKKEKQNINSTIKSHKFKFSVNHLINFCLQSLKLRENYKFLFTRTLSDAIQLIRLHSKKNKTYKFLHNVDINLILKNKISYKKIKEKSANNIKRNFYNNFIKLPYLIVSKNDFFISSILLSKPNFITEKFIRGELVILDGNKIKKNIKNKIIIIENADPGYDWIFSKNIKGLITKFGGVNSHMSIRCEEKQLPAAIGVGEDNFNKLLNIKNIEIDCKLQKINLGY